MNSMLLYPSLKDRLLTQHESIQPIIASVTNERLHLQPQPGKWSIHDNIAHLAKYQPVFIERVHRIAKGNNPSFDPYRAENDAEFPIWQGLDLNSLLLGLNANRQIIYEMITQLSGEQLEMTGEHKKFGRLNIIQWTEFFLLHEAHHIFTIFQLANNKEL